MTRPYILLTNDDGINALGLSVLYHEIRKVGEVVIVAPDSERSAAGHAITITEPLRAKKIYRDGSFCGYAINGTPADSIKMAVKALLPKNPDLVISGINLGPNTGTNVIYSGTVSAATEAVIMGLKAIAVSLGTFVNPDYLPAAHFIRSLAEMVLARGLPPKVLLNVNVPAVPEEKIRGVKVTHQGIAKFQEVMEERTDLRGRAYYWLGGEMDAPEEDPASDHAALMDNYIAITPLHYDMTNYKFLPELKSWNIEWESRKKGE
ncbi:MAG: 5'/3'-nucleotidase SurE [Candidatus Euphemobacter frigidus]|nr:5'/3'-nucleotidase SurE [Candidatus Euphemobacter frigidus]